MKFSELPQEWQDKLNESREDLVRKNHNGKWDLTLFNKEGTRYFFAHYNSPGGLYGFSSWTVKYGQVGFAKTKDKKGLNNISFITLNHNGVAPIVSEVIKNLQKNNVNIVGQHTFNMGERDFRILLLKSTQEKPDIYFFCSFAGEMETIRRQMLEAEIKTPVTSVECMDLLKDNSLYEGSWYVGDASEKNPRILERITNEKKVNPTRGTPFVYDIVNLLVWAYENTPVKQGQAVPSNADVIKTIQNRIDEYPSIFGTVSVSKDGIIQTDALVKMIQNGKIVPVEE